MIKPYHLMVIIIGILTIIIISLLLTKVEIQVSQYKKVPIEYFSSQGLGSMNDYDGNFIGVHGYVYILINEKAPYNLNNLSNFDVNCKFQTPEGTFVVRGSKYIQNERKVIEIVQPEEALDCIHFFTTKNKISFDEINFTYDVIKVPQKIKIETARENVTLFQKIFKFY